MIIAAHLAALSRDIAQYMRLGITGCQCSIDMYVFLGPTAAQLAGGWGVRADVLTAPVNRILVRASRARTFDLIGAQATYFDLHRQVIRRMAILTSAFETYNLCSDMDLRSFYYR